MRGKGIPREWLVAECRITPAYAGKSNHLCRSFRDRRDHPRLCGEKIQILRILFKIGGSPPPMRGKAASVVGMALAFRITPAYAGKS